MLLALRVPEATGKSLHAQLYVVTVAKHHAHGWMQFANDEICHHRYNVTCDSACRVEILYNSAVDI